MLRLPGDNLRILVEGQRRARVTRLLQDTPYFRAEVRDCLTRRVNDPLRDAALVRECREAFQAYAAVAQKLPADIDYLITAEATSIPLIYEIAKQMKMPRYLIARKSVKGYMSNPIVTEVHSITTDKIQTLCLDAEDVERIRGAKIAIVDDVISTGSSLAALEYLVEKAGGTVVAKAAILAEGDAADRPDILYLEKIPLFFK